MQRSGIDTIKYHTWPEYKWEVTNSQLDTTTESQEVSPFPAGDHRTHTNRRSQRDRKNPLKINKRSTALERLVKYLLEGLNPFNPANLTFSADVDHDT